MSDRYRIIIHYYTLHCNTTLLNELLITGNKIN